MFEVLKDKIPDEVYNGLSTATFFGINTPLRLAHFLAQASHESENFTATTENLNYSASGLIATWPHIFSNPVIAEQYAHDPEKIANLVYSNRMGNSDQDSGDGFLYRGRGFIQITGRDNYTAFNHHVKNDNVVDNPDLVASRYPLMSATWFFGEHGCNEAADGGSAVENIVNVTKHINSGLLGLADRITKFNYYWNILKPEAA